MAKPPFDCLDPRNYSLPPGLEGKIHSPALLIFMPQVRSNLQRMLGHVGSPGRWRPHLKTTKMPAIWRELVLLGILNFKCATVREARHLARLLTEMCVEDGDLLVAYPLVGPALKSLGRLAQEFPSIRFSVLAENPEAIPQIDPALEIFIDLNPGMHRTGIPMEQGDEILSLARQAGERFRGLHYYDGHLHSADLNHRRMDAFRGYDQLMELSNELGSQGLVVGELITSGTPAFQQALAYPGFETGKGPVHRVSPGTVVLHDLRSELENPDLELVPAACLFSRVVSQPTPDSITLDAGSKSIAAEAGDPCAFVLGQPAWSAQTPSEEHLPLKLAGEPLPARGTTLLLVPMHICPTVNLADQVLLIDDGEYCVQDVQARGHDLLDEA